MSIIINQILTSSHITNIKIIEKKIAIIVIKKITIDLNANMRIISHNLMNEKKFINLKFNTTVYKQQNDAKNKVVISFNQDNTDLMTKAKIFSISKKNSD